MAGREDAAHHLDRGRREVDLPGAELLDHLRHVAMPGRLVGAHRAAALGVVARVARRVAALARPGLDLHHRALREPAAVEGAQGQDGRGRVAAGAGDEFGIGELLPVQLRHPVDELSEQVGTRMLPAVPAHVPVRVAQPEVRAQVDDSRRERAKLVDAGHRLSVGQAEEQHVAGLELGGGGELEPRRPAEVRMRVVHELPGQPFRGDLAHLDARMEQEEAQQLATGVSGRAGDRGPDHRPRSATPAEVLAVIPAEAGMTVHTAQGTPSTVIPAEAGMKVRTAQAGTPSSVIPAEAGMKVRTAQPGKPSSVIPAGNESHGRNPERPLPSFPRKRE